MQLISERKGDGFKKAAGGLKYIIRGGGGGGGVMVHLGGRE